MPFQTPYVGREVSSATLSALVDALRELDDIEDVEGLPDLVAMSEPGHRISWDECRAMMALAEERFGRKGLRAIAAGTLKEPRFRFRTWLATTLLRPWDAIEYYLLPQWDPDFPLITSFVENKPGEINVYASLATDYEPCESFFHCLGGAFEGMMSSFSIRGRFTINSTGGGAHYVYAFDPPTGMLASLRNAISSIFMALLTVPNLFRIKRIMDRKGLDLINELARRRATELKLSESEATMRRRIENSRDLIFEYDHDLCLVYASPNVEQQLGYSEDVLMTSPFSMVPGDSQLRFREALGASGAEGPLQQMDLIDISGKPTWYELSFSRFRADGGSHTLVVARDISERKQFDEDLLNLQKLESLGVLAGSVAHDFNNLLVPVLGNAEFLLDQVEGDEQRDIVQQIHDAALKASDLTKQLLIYAGDRTATFSTIDLKAETEELTNLLRASVPRTVRLNLQLDDGVMVEGDVVQLRQVIMNLVTNAAESIEGSDGEVNLALSKAEKHVSLRVTDNGVGLTPAEINKIFTPFYTTKVAGRGLGLAAVQGIVKAHQGEITVASEPGHGSTFEVLLPVSSTKVTRDLREETPEGTGTILVIDDEAQVRDVAEKLLRSRGFMPVTEGDPDVAIERFRESPKRFDAVLLDVMMPKRSGLEVLKILREIREDVPVLLVTGYSSDIAMESSVPGVSVLRKPYRLNDLVSALNAVTEGREVPPQD